MAYVALPSLPLTVRPTEYSRGPARGGIKKTTHSIASAIASTATQTFNLDEHRGDGACIAGTLEVKPGVVLVGCPVVLAASGRCPLPLPRPSRRCGSSPVAKPQSLPFQRPASVLGRHAGAGPS